jgi:lipoate-protein ligase A
LPLHTAGAEELLAAGVAMLDSLADDPQPTLRWYRSTDAALVLGRGQHARLFAGADLPVVGRFSGGGAVLMDDGLLSLDVLVPAGHPLLDGDLSAPFERIGEAWAAALVELGVPDVVVHRGPATTPRRASERDRLIAAICYATLGRGEVTSGGRKIVGLAQRRRRPGALIQCGLLRRWHPEPLLRALGAAVDDEQIRTAAAGLEDFLPSPPSDERIMTAVEAALGRVGGAT